MWNNLVKSILAGIFISLGCMVYLAAENPYIGSVLFAAGLYAVLVFELNLFTGKASNLTDEGFSFLKDLGIILIGNLAGTLIMGYAVQYTRMYAKFSSLKSLTAEKINDTPLSLLILAILCGTLMYTAVRLYTRTGSPIGVFVCVPLFILTGLEHCIANMFFFTAANAWSLKAVLLTLLMIAGNALGCNLLPLCGRVSNSRGGVNPPADNN